LREKIQLTGAGRTDSGVHATFYVADFVTKNSILDFKKLVKNLNGFLNKDIVVYDIFQVSENFNSRFDAIQRTYFYIISKQKNPFSYELSYFNSLKLNIEKMNEAAKILFEYEDFSSFEKLHSDNKTSRCKIIEANWFENEQQIFFKISADRFLRNMVRSIVGTMLDIGQEKISKEKFRQIIEAKNRNNSGASVVASGLFLTDIIYPEPINTKLNFTRKLVKVLI